MNELISIATAIGYAYLIFAVIVAIIVFVITLRYFGKIRREMAEMEQRHKEMRERFEGKRKHQFMTRHLHDLAAFWHFIPHNPRNNRATKRKGK